MDAVDVIAATLVFRPHEVSRNRNFALHGTAEGTLARRRASRIRGILRQLTGGFGPARRVELNVLEDGEIALHYTLAKVALERSARLSPCDLAILRVALLRAGARLLPAALMPTDDDRARVETLLAQTSSARNAINVSRPSDG